MSRNTFDDAIRAWDEQTKLVEAAPSIHAENLPLILEGIAKQREMLALMPFSEAERCLALVAIARFEIACIEKAGN